MSKKIGKFYTVPLYSGTSMAAKGWTTVGTATGPTATPTPAYKPKKRVTKFKFGDKELTPLTEAEAMSLDAADEVKYIGKPEGDIYRDYGRRIFKLWEPTYHPNKKAIVLGKKPYFTRNIPIKDLALVKRGDPTAYAYGRARRYVPATLKRVKVNLESLIKQAVQSTDFYIEQLPLHKKLELFKSFTPAEQQLYDFIYKDVNEVLHPEEEKPVEPTNNS